MVLKTIIENMNLFDMFRTIAIYDSLNYQKLLSKKLNSKFLLKLLITIEVFS